MGASLSPTAFKTSLTKHRETHIKRLPVLTLGSSLRPKEPVPVEVAPEFRVEPTATVYLRYARAYRFLHNAMRGGRNMVWVSVDTTGALAKSSCLPDRPRR